MAITTQRVTGQLPAAKGTLYTAAGDEDFLLATLTNTDSAARNINLYIHDGTASRRITPVDYSMGVGDCIDRAGPWPLNSGDLVEGDASAANKVDYVIHIKRYS